MALLAVPEPILLPSRVDTQAQVTLNGAPYIAGQNCGESLAGPRLTAREVQRQAEIG